MSINYSTLHSQNSSSTPNLSPYLPPEVIQEGWYFILMNKSNLYECWYQIYSDGMLTFRMDTETIYKFTIANIKFSLFDAASSLSTGCGLMLSFNNEDFYFIFDHILDMKRFCFGCYRTSDGNNLQNVLSQMNWLKESSDLKLNPSLSSPNKKSNIKSYLQSFVRVSMQSNRSSFKPDLLNSSSNDPNSDEITHESSPKHLTLNTKMSFDYDKIFRRLSSLNEQSLSSKSSENLFPSKSNSTEEIPSPRGINNVFSPIFTSTALCRLYNDMLTQSPNELNTLLHGTVQLFQSGTLIINYENIVPDKINDDGEQLTQKVSQSFSCRKVLCSKYKSNNNTLLLPSSGDDFAQVAFTLRIFTVQAEGAAPGRRPTPPVKPFSQKGKRGNNLTKNDDYTEIILIFPSLTIAKSFLLALSSVVPIHNILGFLIDMEWIDQTEQENVIGTLERTDSDVDNNNVEGYNNNNNNNTKLQLEVCIPETIQEEIDESMEKSIINPNDNLEAKESSPTKPTLANRILRKLSSNDSYSGLENIEMNENNIDTTADSTNANAGATTAGVTSSSSVTPRKSRISRFLGINFMKKESSELVTNESNRSIIDDSETMAERFPGFKYRSQSQLPTNESNLSIVDEMDDIPPQQIAPGRYTTLKQIIGTNNQFSSTITSDPGNFKGVKGTKSDHPVSHGVNTTSCTARARERSPDGLGAVIGGVLFDKLVVKRIEFTPRYLELKLQDIVPLTFKKSDILGGNSLNTNKITPFREIGAGKLSYDGHLILDGVDFSRDKHVEILIRVLDLPIEKSIELLRSWVSNSIEHSNSDVPNHWEEFISNNITIFSQKIREMKENQSEHRSSPTSSSLNEPFDPSNAAASIANGNGKQQSQSKKSSGDESFHIQHLDLRYCQMTNRGVAVLVDSLRKNKKLVSLNLTGNTISRDSTAASLGNMLNFNTSLLDVNLQETNLGNTGATLVAQALHINMSLEKLSLSGNNITDVGCAMLSMALEENTTLLHLNLSRNLIGVDGTKWIAKSFYTNKSLTYLDLNRQHLKGKIGSDGAKYLSRCLRMNNTLRILRIGRNRIGFEGVRYISGMLLLNRGLRILDISHSKIGVEGAIQLANALIQNNSLQTILLANRLLPACYLKGVHDSEYYLRESMTRFTLPFDQNEKQVEPIDTSADVSKSIPSDGTYSQYYLDDDIYDGNNHVTLNCDIAYDCQEKSFDKIDLQVLFASNIQSQAYSNFDEWTSETFTSSFGNKNISDDKPSPSSSSPPPDLEMGHDRNSTTRIIRPLAITDEESVLIAHLLRGNNLLQELRLEHTFLPIQLLRGRSLNSHLGSAGTGKNGPNSSIALPVIGSTHMYSLDLSNSNLVSSDATVVGVLIAENPYLRTICLKGNYFNKTDGETWIANAINKNPNVCLDTNIWTAEEMFADGYHQLAALKGVSVSGAAIEPQRLDTIWDKALVILSCLGYYLDVISDIYVTYLYSLNSELEVFVPWTALIICIPTFMTLGSILWTTCSKHPCRATLQIFIVLFQLHPLLHVYESILMEIETTALLDAKFLEGIYEAIPQILLQTYIMFLLSVSSGAFQLPIFLSLLISMLTVSGVLVMVVDRGKIRQITLGPRRKNPWFVRYLAHGLAVLFDGEKLCASNKYGNKSHEGMKELIHYSSYTYSHYIWAVIFHFTTLAVRLIAITWLLAVVGSYKFVVFLIIFFSRATLLFFLDPKSKRRSTLRSVVWCLCYCLITGIWDKDERSPVSSRRAYLLLNVLDTIESTVFICYAAFLSANSHMKLIHGLLTFAAVIVCRAISWILIIKWQLAVHYTELQTEDKLKTSFYDLTMFRLCSRDTHTFIDDVVSRVDTPVIPVPDVFCTNGEKKSTKGRPKSWWSSEERSATMELSYLTAVVDSKLVLFSSPQGVAIKQSSPLSTPRENNEDGGSESPGGSSRTGGAGAGGGGGAGGKGTVGTGSDDKSDGSRDRSHARDWDAMPEVVKQKKGRFQLQGGKTIYTDTDLANNLERHRALARKTRRGFSGWNRHNSPMERTPIRPEELKTSSGEIENDDETVNLVDFQANSKSTASDEIPISSESFRRGTAQLDYQDFIPTKKIEKLPLPSSIEEEKEAQDTALTNHLDLSDLNYHHNDEDMIWEINPTRSLV